MNTLITSRAPAWTVKAGWCRAFGVLIVCFAMATTASSTAAQAPAVALGEEVIVGLPDTFSEPPDPSLKAGRQIVAHISVTESGGAPTILIALNHRTLGPRSLRIALQVARVMRDQGDLIPGRTIAVPLLPTSNAMAEKAKVLAPLVGQIRSAPSQDIPDVGLGKWVRIRSLEDPSAT